MSGAILPVGYQSFSGAMASANGFFDCVVFGTTRHSIIFGPTEQVTAKSTGLETFSFMRTPAGRFGNEIWIQGGTSSSHSDPNPVVGGWWPFRGARRRDDRAAAEGKAAPRSGLVGCRAQSQEDLQAEDQQQPEENDMVIRMDVVTTMTVEVEDPPARSIRYPEPSLSGGRASYESLESLCFRQERRGSSF